MGNFSIDISKAEAQDIWWAITYWMNYIQTGNIHLTNTDAAGRKLPAKPLDIEQMKKIIELDNLRNKMLKHKASITKGE